VVLAMTVEKWTAEQLQKFVGGQYEVQNTAEGYIYRGQIESLGIEGEGEDAELVIKFVWMAKGEGFPPIPTMWVNDSDLSYRMSDLLYRASDPGDGRYIIQSMVELGVFFPPGGSLLDPAKVEGLVLVSHPETQEGEVFLCNADQDALQHICWLTKRMGHCAYDRDGQQIPGFFPIFVQKDEYGREMGYDQLTQLVANEQTRSYPTE